VEISDKLDSMLLDQRKNTQQILGAISGVENLVSDMWQDMDKQFGEMMQQLEELQDMLVDISQRMLLLSWHAFFLSGTDSKTSLSFSWVLAIIISFLFFFQILRSFTLKVILWNRIECHPSNGISSC
jgi:hypothetical protein